MRAPDHVWQKRVSHENNDEHNEEVVEISPSLPEGARQDVQSVLKLIVFEEPENANENVEGVDVDFNVLGFKKELLLEQLFKAVR